jgi:hypothetical protein
MTFGPALSLGVASLAEVVDVKISADVDAAALLEGLCDGAHQGLRFVGGARLGPNDPAVNRVIDTARYVVGIPRSVLDALGGEAWLRDRAAAAMAAASLDVLRRIDGIGKRVYVREFLRSLEIGAGDAETWLARAGIVGDMVALGAEVEVRGSGGVKIAEVVEAVTGDAELPHRAVRIALGTVSGGRVVSPLELELLRALRAKPSPVAGQPSAEPSPDALS